MEPLSFLDGISGYVRHSTNGSADKGIRLAVIDPAYSFTAVPYPTSVPLARVTFEGETTLSGKYYPIASGYVPTPGARVWMVPIGTTWLIAGGAAQYTAQGFYSSPDGVTSGVEFGEGSFFDSISGLNLLTDADIAGDLSVGGIGKCLHKRRTSDGPSVINTTVMQNEPLLFLDLDIGTWECEVVIAYTAAASDIQTAWAFNGAWSGVRYCTGISPYVINTGTVNDTPSHHSAAQRSAMHEFSSAVPYGANDATNYSGLRETGSFLVTTPGRWTFQYTQRVSNASQVMLRRGSYMTARRVG